MKIDAVPVMLAAAWLLLAGCTSSDIRNQDDPGRRFAYAMHTAIDRAKVYPGRAADHVNGKVTVAFDYIDGDTAKNVQVKESSGNPSLDAAALWAVANARLPTKPPGMEGVKHFIVTINF